MFLPVPSPTIGFLITFSRFAWWRLTALPAATSRFTGRDPVCWRHLSNIAHARMPGVPTETANLKIGEFLPLFISEQFIQVNQDQ